MANKLITINLRKYLVNQPRTKRIRKAVKFVRNEVARHAKVGIENVKLSTELNALIFKSAAKHMTSLKLNIAIDNNVAKAALFKEAQAQNAAAKTQEKGKGTQAKAAKEAKPNATGRATQSK